MVKLSRYLTRIRENKVRPYIRGIVLDRGCGDAKAINYKVVTRYFGGTKLGAGGLLRAYGQAASAVLNSCKIEDKFLTEKVKFNVEFDFLNVVHNVIKSFELEIVDSEFSERATFILQPRLKLYQPLKDKLTDATNGQVEFEQI